MISPSYTYGKLSTAVHELAASAGSPRNRLMRALEKSDLLRPSAGFRDSNQRERMEKLQSGLTAVELKNGQSTVRNTVSRMSDEEVRECIEEIVMLYGQICRELSAKIPAHD